MAHTRVCADCLVTHLCPDEVAPVAEAVIVHVDQLRALRVLQDQGLVPRLRHTRRVS